MTCQDMAPLIDALADGSLPAADRARVEAHLDSCPSCRADLDGLQRVMGATAALPRAREPRRDLWESVVARLDDPPAEAAPKLPAARPWWQRPAPLAAAAVALIVLSSGITALLLSPLALPPAVAVTRDLPASVAEMEAEFLHAAADLQAALETLPLEPAMRDRLAGLLLVVDEAIRESRAALTGTPDDASLRDLLWTAHRRKLDLPPREELTP